MNTLINDLTHFAAYLRGEPSRKLKNHLQYYDDHLEELKNNYRKKIISSDDEITEKIKIILENLNIPPSEWQNYLDLTVYNFLLKLNREAHPQIAYILELIDEKTAISKLKLLAGSGIVFVCLAPLLALPSFYGLWITIEGVLTSVIGLPILGLIYTLGNAFFNFYQNHIDEKKTLLNRLRDNFFLLGNTVLNVAAYGFWISAAIPMTPLVAGLFVAASAIDIVKEIAGLMQEHFRFRNSPPIHPASPLLIHQAYIRQVYGFHKHKNALFINLGASVLLFGIMAAWCFVPGGLIVTLGSLAAIGIVHGLKYWLLKTNETITRNHLQRELRHREKAYDLSQLQQVSPALSQLTPEADLDNQTAPNTIIVPEQMPMPRIPQPSPSMTENSQFTYP